MAVGIAQSSQIGTDFFRERESTSTFPDCVILSKSLNCFKLSVTCIKGNNTKFYLIGLCSSATLVEYCIFIFI